MTRTAIGVAIVAVIASAAVGWFAWSSSRQAVLDTVARESLAISRSLVNQVEVKLPQGTPTDQVL